MNKGFKDLIAWQKGYALVLRIYKISSSLPKNELYGLVSQLRRASVSVVANIAEGYERKHRKEYIQFLSISKGSLGEIETLLMLTKDLGYIDEEAYLDIEEQRNEVIKILVGLIFSLGK